jgi:hypothetical protein
MGDNDEEKAKSPFNDEGEEETIALSMDELDGILSEAEIVQEIQEKSDKKDAEGEDLSAEAEEPEGEVSLDDLEEDEEVSIAEGAAEEEFDISSEIDELSPEDLEDIELEVGDVDTYVEGLEDEIEKETELSESEISLEEEEEPKLEETTLEEELEDLDKEIIEDIEVEAEAEQSLPEEELAEAPILGEIDEKLEDLEGLELGDEAFREAGIEGLEVDDEIEDLEIPDILEEEEAPIEAALEEQPPSEEEDLEMTEAASEGEIELTEEEEDILSTDIDLEAEMAETEEVVTVTGEELSKMEEKEFGEETKTIDATLYNDIAAVLKYMDLLLGDLPEEKIEEFSKSTYYNLYKEVFDKLGIK